MSPPPHTVHVQEGLMQVGLHVFALGLELLGDEFPAVLMMKLQLKRFKNREENSVGDEASCSLPKVYLYTLWSTCVHKPLRGD